MNDTAILLSAIILIITIGFVTASFGTEFITLSRSLNTTYYAENITAISSGISNIPDPPVCTFGTEIPLLGTVWDYGGCVGSYVIWMASLMFIETEIQWLSVLFFFPLIAVIGFIIVRTIRSGGG